MTAQVLSNDQVARLSLEEALSEPTIEALASGGTLAIVVSHFVDPVCCEYMGDRTQHGVTVETSGGHLVPIPG